ncbi:hypothetical protein AMR72_01640 [Flavobacterium psychrophilum]|nr:hypothetical protein AMR72_01640 [Flavobacterium psychrophilum]AOE51338.1 hypothetical protein ALW18_01640 [Flavobacterium psychrophilum]
MENQPKKHADNKEFHQQDNTANEKKHNQNSEHKHHVQNDQDDIDDTDKYLAMEQPGVSFTHDTDPTLNSDQSDFGSESQKKRWSEDGGNSKNSEAFNQDDYILEDNLDLDEDQNQSISSDDEDFEETNERY